MKKVVIHIGLHKTGTRYLQRKVFRPLDDEAFLVNPLSISVPLREALREPGDLEVKGKVRDEVDSWRKSEDQRTLVISEPHASGDMYGMHEGHEENAKFLHELFPEAEIIYLTRNVATWLQSAYRQSLVKDPGQPIERFLNFYDGKFHPRPAAWVAGKRNVSALEMQFLKIYNTYSAAFGGNNVYLFTQEQLKNEAELVKGRLADILGLETLPNPPQDRAQNRSFSALAIYTFFPGAWVKDGRPPANKIGQGPGKLRRRLRLLRKLRTQFIKHLFDKVLYKDWDLLKRGGMRQKLDAYYREEEKALAQIADRVLKGQPANGEAVSRNGEV